MEKHEITKQKNRKLYSKKLGTYATLQEVGEMIKEGEEVEVFSKASYSDITPEVLKSVVHQNELASISSLDLRVDSGLMKRILLSGGLLPYAKQLEEKVAQ